MRLLWALAAFPVSEVAMRRDSLAFVVDGELDIARVEELDRLVAPALAGEGVD